MTEAIDTDDGGIEWYHEPIDDCNHDPIPATISAGRAAIDCPTCGATVCSPPLTADLNQIVAVRLE